MMCLLRIRGVVAMRMPSQEGLPTCRVPISGSVLLLDEYEQGKNKGLTQDICPYTLPREDLDVRADAEATHPYASGNVAARHQSWHRTHHWHRLVHGDTRHVRYLSALCFWSIAYVASLSRCREGNGLLRGDDYRRVPTLPLARSVEYELCRNHAMYLHILEPLYKRYRGHDRGQILGSYFFARGSAK